jgi:hypothetical protein
MAAYVAILIDRCIASGGPFPRYLVGAAVGRCVGAATARCKVAGWCWHGGRSQQLDREAGACWTLRGVGSESSLLLELLDYEGRP